MVIDMLEGVAEMINASKEVEVQCALKMLNKIINGMKHTNVLIEEPVKLTPPKKLPSKKNDEYAIIPNDDGSIKEIIGPSEDGSIELDGKVYTFKEAIGKKFTTGRIIG